MTCTIATWLLAVTLSAQTPPAAQPPAPAGPPAAADQDRPVPATPDTSAGDAQQSPPESAPESTEPVQPATPPELERDPIKRLLNELTALRDELYLTRQQLAEAILRGAATHRELDELRQFMVDHEQFGADFAKYKVVKDIAEKEARQREAEINKQKREIERAERDARMKAARAERAARDAQSQKVARYRRNGFSPLGLDVYSGKWSFYYQTTDTTQSRIDYQPGIGNYVRLYPGKEIDFGQMTISGSVINGSDQVRNVGIAIAFFDENGSQVGHETVQVNNARPDVPYPFTSKINMALNRAFDSSSTYVLYADPIEEVEAPGPANTSVGVPAQNDGSTDKPNPGALQDSDLYKDLLSNSPESMRVAMYYLETKAGAPAPKSRPNTIDEWKDAGRKGATWLESRAPDIAARITSEYPSFRAAQSPHYQD